MKHLHVNTKVLTIILFFLLLLPSCNNEELFVVEKSAIIAEETENTEEDVPNSEDEVPPIQTVNDVATTIENVPVEIRVLINDNNLPSSGTLSNTEPSNGSLSINDNNTSDDQTDDFIIYTPNTGFVGVDYFEYTVCDTATPPNCNTALVEITVNPNVNSTILKAFPSAFGQASSTTSGGRNGVLILVNTLNTSEGISGPYTNGDGDTYYTAGPTAAINEYNAGISARYIVYNVSGNVLSGTTAKRNNVTIFGQSAPEGGITYSGGNLQFDGASNIIVRYIRARNGQASQSQMDGSGTTGGSGYGIVAKSGSALANPIDDIIFDHVSASWGGDKGILLGTNTVTSQKRHTVQRCLISDSHTYLQVSCQNAYNFRNENDSNDRVNRNHYSVYYNLFARGSNRTPNIGATGGYIDVINNVIQSDGSKLGVLQWIDNAKVNWNRNWYHHTRTNYMRNEWQWSGGSSGKYHATNKIYNEIQLHSRGNYFKGGSTVVLNGTENNDNAAIWAYRNIAGGSSQSDYYQTDMPPNYFVDNEHNGIANKPPFMTATEAYESIVSDGNVGACHYIKDDGTVGYYTDSWDADLITNVAAGTMQPLRNTSFWILPNLPINTRPESYDTDNDGMADVWERANFGGNLDQGYNDDFDNDGYTNIEEYYNQVDFK